MRRSMGRADVILKRMSHLTVVLGERDIQVTPKQSESKETKEPKSKEIKSSAKGKKQKVAAQAARS